MLLYTFQCPVNKRMTKEEESCWSIAMLLNTRTVWMKPRPTYNKYALSLSGQSYYHHIRHPLEIHYHWLEVSRPPGPFKRFKIKTHWTHSKPGGLCSSNSSLSHVPLFSWAHEQTIHVQSHGYVGQPPERCFLPQNKMARTLRTLRSSNSY